MTHRAAQIVFAHPATLICLKEAEMELVDIDNYAYCGDGRQTPAAEWGRGKVLFAVEETA